MSTSNLPENTLVLKNVRLSFPNLFVPQQPKKGDTGGKPKFNVCIVLDKKTHAKEIKAIQEMSNAVAAKQWPQGVSKAVKFCLRDGSERDDKEGFSDAVMFLNASTQSRPAVVDRDPTKPIVEADGKIYGGCYANVSINIWSQDNDYGKRVNAGLGPVQWMADGERFGGGAPAATEVFSNEAGTADEDDDI